MQSLQGRTFPALRVRSFEELQELVRQNYPISSVLVDFDSLPHSDEEKNDTALISGIRTSLPGATLICMSNEPETRRVVAAVRAGASNFIASRTLDVELESILRSNIARDPLSGDNGLSDRFGLLPDGPGVGELAANGSPVLILGERHVGKGRLAKTIHAQSSRSSQPFIRVDCGDLEGELAVRALVGYEAGAFVGAFQSHSGQMQSAGAGVIVFESVHRLSRSLQALVAQTIASRQVASLGGSPAFFGAKVIATSNLSREQLTASALIRELLDCFGDNIVTVRALRNRRDELIALASSLLTELTGPNHGALLDPELCAAIREYSWPGNLKEMLQVLYVLCETRNSRYVADLLRSARPARRRLVGVG